MPGLIESVFAGAANGFSNATQQNNAAELGSMNRQLDFSVRELMEQRIAERNKAGEAEQYARNRGDVVSDKATAREQTLADQDTAQKNALELQREKNKGYATARASGGAKGMAGYNEWKKDNPDGTYEEFLQTVSSAKVNDSKLIADTAQKLLTEERKNFNDKYTMDQAIEDAKKLHGGESVAKTVPAKPFNLKDFQR